MAKHLHIPLQSGSNKILEKMNRKYDLKFFNKRIEKIKKEIEDISNTIDLIVGILGETEDDFNEKINMLRLIIYVYRNPTCPKIIYFIRNLYCNISLILCNFWSNLRLQSSV